MANWGPKVTYSIHNVVKVKEGYGGISLVAQYYYVLELS